MYIVKARFYSSISNNIQSKLLQQKRTFLRLKYSKMDKHNRFADIQIAC